MSPAVPLEDWEAISNPDRVLDPDHSSQTVILLDTHIQSCGQWRSLRRLRRQMSAARHEIGLGSRDEAAASSFTFWELALLYSRRVDSNWAQPPRVHLTDKLGWPTGMRTVPGGRRDCHAVWWNWAERGSIPILPIASSPPRQSLADTGWPLPTAPSPTGPRGPGSSRSLIPRPKTRAAAG